LIAGAADFCRKNAEALENPVWGNAHNEVKTTEPQIGDVLSLQVMRQVNV